MFIIALVPLLLVHTHTITSIISLGIIAVEDFLCEEKEVKKGDRTLQTACHFFAIVMLSLCCVFIKYRHKFIFLFTPLSAQFYS
jgi:hypothetical protein